MQMNKRNKNYYPILLLGLLLIGTQLLSQPVANSRAGFEKYQSLYRKYVAALQSGKDAGQLAELANELKAARKEYEQAGGDPSRDVLDQNTEVRPADNCPEIDGCLASGSLMPEKSPEEKEFDSLMGKLYSPDRIEKAAVLAEDARKFLAAAKNPYFQMEATFALAELVFDSKKDPLAAEKILSQFAARAPTAEARRIAKARINLFRQESRINLERAKYDSLQTACVNAWGKYLKTSWLAFPVKITRFGSWLGANLKRRSEASSLKKMLEEYDKIANQTFPNGTLNQLTHSSLIPCNDVTLLINGRSSFARRYALAGIAQDRILVQTLLYHNDETGNRLADILIERAQAGVEVKVIVDDAFARGRKTNVLRRMENGGVKVRINNPILNNPLKANFRSHQKMFVVDDEVAIVGGMNIADEYAKGEIAEFGWRDTDAEVRGPVVQNVMELFDRNWEALGLNQAWVKGASENKELTKLEEKLPILPNRDKLIPGPLPMYFQNPPVFKNVRVRFLKTYPVKSSDDDILDLFIAYLSAAKREVTFESAYFIPNPNFRDAILKACERGVKVRILTNSVESNNHPNAGYAGRASYEDVVRAGAEIYEWQGAQTIHSKVSLFDDFAVTLGAYNLNSRSHSCDSEDILALEDRRIGTAFKRIMNIDLRRARLVTIEDIQNWRGNFSERMKQDFFKTFKSFF